MSALDYLDCKDCVSGHKGNHTCKLASDIFGCFAGVPALLLPDVLGTELYQKKLVTSNNGGYPFE